MAVHPSTHLLTASRYGVGRRNRIVNSDAPCIGRLCSPNHCSDYTGEQTKLSKILLNGNNICMVCIHRSTAAFSPMLTIQPVDTWWRGPNCFIILRESSLARDEDQSVMRTAAEKVRELLNSTPTQGAGRCGIWNVVLSFPCVLTGGNAEDWITRPSKLTPTAMGKPTKIELIKNFKSRPGEPMVSTG